MEHFTREEFLCIFTPLPPENGGFSVFLSVIFVLLIYQTQAWRITVRFVFLYFCKRKIIKGFAYTLLNQQMNHLLIIIYIIGTHTCFHKNTKMQNMSTKASLQDLCRLTLHLNFFYTPPGAWHGKNYGMAWQKNFPRHAKKYGTHHRIHLFQ